ncbi:hypothetical protein GF326_04970 [Candidatus Bathyarchaeota archaeon]|nr:hypothetical protein [Candidatus Bathyarchaeota archaeon]
MLTPYAQNAIMQIFIVALLCVGFSFSYQLEKFPNLSYVTLSKFGALTAYTLTKLMDYNPYLALPTASIVCGLISVLIYTLIIQPINRRGRGKISLTIATLALSTVLSTLVAMFSYWVLVTTGQSSKEFLLRNYDFTYQGYPGVLFVSPIVSILVLVALTLTLYKTSFGTTLRAVSDNEELAAVLGINTYQRHLWSWFISGALTGLAGSIIPFWRATPLGYADDLLVFVMAGCFIGGIDSLYGAVIGSVIVVLSLKGMQDNVIAVLRQNNCEIWLYEFGFYVHGLPQLTPYIILWLVLLIEPSGLAGLARKIARKLRG